MKLDKILSEMKEKATILNSNDYPDFLAIQITLTDLEEVFYVEIKEGKLTIEPYEYIDRQANIMISSDKFMKIIEKKINPVTAFATNQLKIEGSQEKALELVKLF